MASDDFVAGGFRVNESAGDPASDTARNGAAPADWDVDRHGPVIGMSTRRYRRAAARISSVTLSGWLIIATCELRFSTTTAPSSGASGRVRPKCRWPTAG